MIDTWSIQYPNYETHSTLVCSRRSVDTLVFCYLSESESIIFCICFLWGFFILFILPFWKYLHIFNKI